MKDGALLLESIASFLYALVSSADGAPYESGNDGFHPPIISSLLNRVENPIFNFLSWFSDLLECAYLLRARYPDLAASLPETRRTYSRLVHHFSSIFKREGYATARLLSTTASYGRPESTDIFDDPCFDPVAKQTESSDLRSTAPHFGRLDRVVGSSMAALLCENETKTSGVHSGQHHRHRNISHAHHQTKGNRQHISNISDSRKTKKDTVQVSCRFQPCDVDPNEVTDQEVKDLNSIKSKTALNRFAPNAYEVANRSSSSRSRLSEAAESPPSCRLMSTHEEQKLSRTVRHTARRTSWDFSSENEPHRDVNRKGEGEPLKRKPKRSFSPRLVKSWRRHRKIKSIDNIAELSPKKSAELIVKDAEPCRIPEIPDGGLEDVQHSAFHTQQTVDGFTARNVQRSLSPSTLSSQVDAWTPRDKRTFLTGVAGKGVHLPITSLPPALQQKPRLLVPNHQHTSHNVRLQQLAGRLTQSEKPGVYQITEKAAAMQSDLTCSGTEHGIVPFPNPLGVRGRRHPTSQTFNSYSNRLEEENSLSPLPRSGEDSRQKWISSGLQDASQTLLGHANIYTTQKTVQQNRRLPYREESIQRSTQVESRHVSGRPLRRPDRAIEVEVVHASALDSKAKLANNNNNYSMNNKMNQTPTTPVSGATVIYQDHIPLVVQQKRSRTNSRERQISSSVARSKSPTASRLPDLELDLTEVKVDALVGRGATSQVFRGSWRGTAVAIKLVHTDTAEASKLGRRAGTKKEFYRELGIMLRLRHPNLVLFMGANTNQNAWCVMTEYCAGGNLFELLHGCRSKKSSKWIVPKYSLNWQQKIKICADIARACQYLHSSEPAIIHRDLKSLNVLLVSPITADNDVPQVKVSDFGLSRINIGPKGEWGHLTGMAGTYHWMAPEVILNKPYCEKADVYSFGIVMYEIITQSIPYCPKNSEQQHHRLLSPVGIAIEVARGKRPDLNRVPNECPQLLLSIMQSCWRNQPAKRPSFKYIVEKLATISL